MEKCQILGVVSFPQFAFSHFGAGVKSSIVFARRLDKGETLQDYPVFMALAEHIGYDATGRKDATNELKLIATKFHEFQADPVNFR